MSTRIKIIRTDGVLIMILIIFLVLMVLFIKKSCAYTPEQNGVVKRKHRHIVEVALSLMTRSALSIHLWSYAFAATIFLINRLPSSSLRNKSPFELLFHKLLDYLHLKTFGCACYHLLKPYNTHKIQPKT